MQTTCQSSMNKTTSNSIFPQTYKTVKSQTNREIAKTNNNMHIIWKIPLKIKIKLTQIERTSLCTCLHSSITNNSNSASSTKQNYLFSLQNKIHTQMSLQNKIHTLYLYKTKFTLMSLQNKIHTQSLSKTKFTLYTFPKQNSHSMSLQKNIYSISFQNKIHTQCLSKTKFTLYLSKIKFTLNISPKQNMHFTHFSFRYTDILLFYM